MKTCKSCGLSLAEEAFGRVMKLGKAYPRHVCKPCMNGRVRAKAAEIVANAPPAPTAPLPPPPLPPLERAKKEHVDAKDKRDLKAEHRALIEENEQLKARLELHETVKTLSPTIIVYEKPKDERADAVACATASDWHIEEPVESASVHGLNEYNLEIAQRRSEFFYKNSLRLAHMTARDSNVLQLHTNYLGDFISGHIHEELLSSSLLNPGEAISFCAGLLISGIEYQLKESDFILTGDMIPGNHGRMTHQVWHSDPTGTSLETLMYQMVARHFKDEPRVRLNVASHAMVYRRFFEKFVMRLIHGYEVKFGGGVGGITIPLNKKIEKWDVGVRADLTVLGHFHQYFPGQRFLVNGSLIGYNTYAQAIGAAWEAAKQAFFLVHARGGGQTCLHAPIWVDEIPKEQSLITLG